jgi:hypothetical protein
MRIAQDRRTERALPIGSIMEISERYISKIIRSIVTALGCEIAMVRCSDGSYGIVWDGRLVESLDWNSDRYAECESFIESLAASMATGTVQPCRAGGHSQ